VRIEALIYFFDKHKIEFFRDGENLKVSSKSRKLTADEWSLIRSRKSEILAAVDLLSSLEALGCTRSGALGVTEHDSAVCDCGSHVGIKVTAGILCGHCEKLNPPWVKQTNLVSSTTPGLAKEIETV
jgi:hypothetical protein